MRFFIITFILIFFIFSNNAYAFLDNDNSYNKNSISFVGYTHTVFVEGGTASTCGYCAISSNWINSIYNSMAYDFEFVELVMNKNSHANQRCKQLDIYSIPDYVFDGDYTRHLGSDGLPRAYTNLLDECGSRDVHNIDLNMDVFWKNNSMISIDVEIINNEYEDYYGRIRTYVVEIESRWKTSSGKPYHHAMIGDYAINENVIISNLSSLNISSIWNGNDYGFNDIEINNIMIISAIFADDTKFVDDTISSYPQTQSNYPPNLPSISGATNGKIGQLYEYSLNSIDINDDDVFFYINWGDGIIETTPLVKSGEEIIVEHFWENENTYNISVKAIDIYNAESNWNFLEIKMAKSNSFDIFELIIRFLIDNKLIFPIFFNGML